MCRYRSATKARGLVLLVFALVLALGVPAVALAGTRATPSIRGPFHYRVLGHHRWQGRVSGAVYVMTNESANAVTAFVRDKDGSLDFAGTYPTGGAGTAAGLGSQGALAMTADGKWIVSVNASSNDLSVFAVRQHGVLKLVDTESAAGTMPVSVSVVGQTVYVLDAGGSGNIAGFRMSWRGKLTPIPGSVQPLSNLGVGAAPSAEQIGIKPNGREVVVTEKSTNLIDVYALHWGVASAPTVFPSVGGAPYGFAFSPWGKLVVSEAASNSVSSYHVGPMSLDVISPSVPDSGTAPCWVTISPNGRFVYVSDAHSNDISVYGIGWHGMLTLLSSPAGTVNTPLDLDVTNDGRFLYVLGAGSNTVDGFSIGANGMISPLGSLMTIPPSSTGLVAW